MKVSFGRHKILKCPLCLKRFNSKYAMDYHKKNAKMLCPKYEEVKSLDINIIWEADKDDA